jgi:serine/threonine protein kinase
MDLGHYLFRHQPLAANLVQSYAFQLLCGVYHLHVHGIIHCNLQPANLLIDAAGMLKICDFRRSRFLTTPAGEDARPYDGMWYRAPETLSLEQSGDLPGEVWSIGCIIAELARGEPIARGDCALDQIDKLFAAIGHPSRDEKTLLRLEAFDGDGGRADLYELLRTKDAHFVDLMARMLTYDPRKRITVAESLRHPYFDSVHRYLLTLCWPAEMERRL